MEKSLLIFFFFSLRVGLHKIFAFCLAFCLEGNSRFGPRVANQFSCEFSVKSFDWIIAKKLNKKRRASSATIPFCRKTNEAEGKTFSCFLFSSSSCTPEGISKGRTSFYTTSLVCHMNWLTDLTRAHSQSESRKKFSSSSSSAAFCLLSSHLDSLARVCHPSMNFPENILTFFSHERLESKKFSYFLGTHSRDFFILSLILSLSDGKRLNSQIETEEWLKWMNKWKELHLSRGQKWGRRRRRRRFHCVVQREWKWKES